VAGRSCWCGSWRGGHRSGGGRGTAVRRCESCPGSLSVVVRPADRVAETSESRQEQGAFELLVAASGGAFAADGRAGSAGYGRQAGVGGEVRSGAEGCAVTDVDEHGDGGPDAPRRAWSSVTSARGCASNRAVSCSAMLSRSSRALRSCRARPAMTQPKVSVPGMTTVCWSSAVRICSGNRVASLRDRGARRAWMPLSPSVRSGVGVGAAASSSRTPRTVQVRAQ